MAGARLTGAVVKGVEAVEAGVGLLTGEGDVADGGGHGGHVAECGGVVQYGRSAEGLCGGCARGGALEAIDRWNVQLVGAVAVSHFLSRDLDLLLRIRVQFDHAVQ